MRKHLAMILALTALCAFGCGDDEDGGDNQGGVAGTTAGTTAGTGSAGTGSAGTGTAGTGTAGTGSAGTGTAGTGEADAGAEKDIVATALAAGTFTKLAEALTQAELVEALQGDGPFTVFAPTDAAFEAFEADNPGVLAGLSKEELSNVPLYHVVSGTYAAADLKNDGVLTTLSGSPVIFDLEGGAKINDANITTTDIIASNGVIHVIDAVITPPADDIVATAVAAGMFTSLADALGDAMLVDDLQGEGPFTVFAPTDTAFGALPAVPAGQDLVDVLLYHVVSGAVGSGDLVDGTVPTLLENESVTIDVSASGVQVNAANVTTANILAKNGVIHVVDGVLTPQ